MEKHGLIFDASWLEKEVRAEPSSSKRRVVCRAGVPPSTWGKKAVSFKSKPILWLANSLILASLIGLLFTFGPVAKTEISYRAKKALNKMPEAQRTTFGDLLGLPAPGQALAAPNASFSIVIPKIEARAAIFANVDAGNSAEFSQVLSHGQAAH